MTSKSIYGNHVIVIILLLLLAAFYIFNTTSSKLSIQTCYKGDDGVVVIMNASTSTLGTNSNASSILTDLTEHVASGDETKSPPPPKKNTTNL